MIGRPSDQEAAPYYRLYIDQVPGDDPIVALDTQVEEFRQLCARISDQQSLFRYEPDKWSLRQVLNHITDTERIFVFRALWFARGFHPPLPGFDQDTAVSGAEADRVNWLAHIEEFRQVRLATISFFRNLPPESWRRSGVADGNPFTVRALAFISAGHAAHHLRIIGERYL